MRKLDIFLIALFILITVGMATLRYETSQRAATQEFGRLSADGIEALDTRIDSYLHSRTGVAALSWPRKRSRRPSSTITSNP